MSISPELHARVMDRIQECIAVVLGASSTLTIPVTYRTDMNRVSGIAWGNTQTIDLNEPLFLHNTEAFFAREIPHEVAHILQDIMYPNAKQHHGPEWKSIMGLLGGPTTRRHSYDVSVSTTMERFRYTCNCKDRSFNVTKILHNKMQKGQKRFCNTCTGRAVYSPIGE